jgi:hypothetical protein
VREGEGGTSRRACKRSSRMASGSETVASRVGQTAARSPVLRALEGCVRLQIRPTVIVPGRGLR